MTGVISYKLFSVEERLDSIRDNMMSFAYTLTSNREEAEDLFQDTTLKVLHNADKYVDNVNFKGWVFTIMRNIFINNYRRIVKAQTIVDKTQDLYLLNLPQESGFLTPECAYNVSEITRIIKRFPEEYRKPFYMHIIGYKYEEIAREMHLPLGTVKSRIYFTRKRLQKILSGYYR